MTMLEDTPKRYSNYESIYDPPGSSASLELATLKAWIRCYSEMKRTQDRGMRTRFFSCTALIFSD